MGPYTIIITFFNYVGGFSIFFLSRQKENAGKRKRRPGDFEFPPDPLKRPRKPLRFSWIFPAPGSGLVEPTSYIAHRGKRDGTQAVPYAEIGIFTRNSEQFRRGRPMCRPAVRTQANPYNLSNFIGSRFTRPIQTQLLTILVPIVGRRVVRCCKASP